MTAARSRGPVRRSVPARRRQVGQAIMSTLRTAWDETPSIAPPLSRGRLPRWFVFVAGCGERDVAEIEGALTLRAIPGLLSHGGDELGGLCVEVGHDPVTRLVVGCKDHVVHGSVTCVLELEWVGLGVSEVVGEAPAH